MNNKIIYIVIGLLVLAAAGFFLWKDWTNPLSEQEEQQEETTFNTFVNNDNEFELQIPSTWMEVVAPEGIRVLLSNIGEEQIDSEREKEGFRSYLAVTYDVLDEKTMDEFVDYVEGVLESSLPSIEFATATSMTIDTREARAVEALVTQDGYEFKTLLVIIKGDDGDVWTLSFNTAEIRWNHTKDLFYQMAESFKLK